MKKSVLVLMLIIAGITLITNACNTAEQTPVATNTPPSDYDSLKKVIAAMKPGLGEIMLGVQTHHAKLWFAGKNSNWDLANFEMDEIKELMEMAKQVETDRPEIASLPMIFPALDSLTASIKNQDEKSFESNFETLTNTCNSCHVKTNFAFNVITIPTAPPVSNQNFAKPDYK